MPMSSPVFGRPITLATIHAVSSRCHDLNREMAPASKTCRTAKALDSPVCRVDFG